ncbi:MAG: biotin/lipoyl-binding protein [Phycisphaerales bacterium]|nr:MAG: biotin/lipoyl-binding protein [Phycisphaerales bacterium]
MKKGIITLVVIAAVVGGLVMVGRGRGSLFEQEGVLVEAKPDRIEIPISASGISAASRRVQIKSKASGTLLKLLVHEGDRVKEGQLMIQLEKIDEQRNVDRAQAEVDRLKATVAEAETAYRQTKRDVPLNLDIAKANLEAVTADRKNAKFTYDRIKGLHEKGEETEQALITAESSYLRAEANVSRLQAEVERAEQGELDIERASNQLKQTQASLVAAEQALADAQQRLKETDIFSPIDGLVVKRFVDVGAIISSATITVTGGTPLLELADTSEIILEAKVDEADIDQVSELHRQGLALGDPPPERLLPTEPERPDEVFVEFEGLHDCRFVGRITEIAQEPEDRANIITYDVRIVLYASEDLRRVRLGMQGTADFQSEQAEGVCVPYEAVVRQTEDRYVVWVPEMKEGRKEAVEREVKVGLSDGVQVIILEGVSEGDEVYKKKPIRFDRKEESE